MSGAAIAVRAADRPGYNEDVIRLFVIATMFWGVVGFAAGTFIALQLAYPALNLGLEWTTFGRLRPLHTSAVIFAFGGNALIGTSLLRRPAHLPRAAVRRPAAGLVRVLGLPAVHRAGRHRLRAGHHPGPRIRRARVVRRPLADHGLGRLSAGLPRHDPASARSRTSTSPTGSTWPSSSPSRCCTSSTTWRCRSSFFGTKSYSLFSGVQDALTQWWYGHNAVGFFLTAGFLGMMYYFVPKQAERPVYSYRLSIIHFWSLIFLYIWAGPHHLHYTALPDWAQMLGMTFSIMLWMPSWGGMINGLMTLSGAWDKLRTDPVLRFLVVVDRLLRHEHLRGAADVDPAGQRAQPLHRLDHRPRAFRRPGLGRLRHLRRRLLPGAAAVEDAAALLAALVEWHFWIATMGIVLYITAMWVSGIMQGLMWRSYDHLGFLQFSFVETVAGDAPVLRHPGLRRRAVPERCPDHGLQSLAHRPRRRQRPRRSRSCARPTPAPPRPSEEAAMSLLSKHEKVETRGLLLLVLILITVSIGGIVEITPLFTIESTIEKVEGVRPYTPARADGPQHLHPRGLLQLPQPDDPAVPRRGRALRPLQPRRREHVRPPVPVGLQAHRARPGAGRRQVFATTGRWRTWSIRAAWCPRASCRPTPSCATTTCEASDIDEAPARRCGSWACPTATR